MGSIIPTQRFAESRFFRTDSAEMRELARHWCAAGWAAPWEGRFGRVLRVAGGSESGGSGSGCSGSGAAPDFFGLPSRSNEPVYVGVGGMHAPVFSRWERQRRL